MLTEPDQRDELEGRGNQQGSQQRGVPATIIEPLPRATYRLKLETEQEVIAHLASATVTNFVRLRPGDRVEVQISPADKTRGRITKLLKD